MTARDRLTAGNDTSILTIAEHCIMTERTHHRVTECHTHTHPHPQGERQHTELTDFAHNCSDNTLKAVTGSAVYISWRDHATLSHLVSAPQSQRGMPNTSTLHPRGQMLSSSSATDSATNDAMMTAASRNPDIPDMCVFQT